MHLRSVIKLCLLLASLTAMAVTTMSMPFPYPDEVPMGQPQPNKSSLTPPPASAVTDTTFLFCSIGAVSLGAPGNDCWGWAAPGGTEYAIAGNATGIAFINTENMQIVDVIPFAESCTWKDIKTYQNYCYAVSECGGSNQGLMVMDMSYLPDSVKYITSVDTYPGVDVTSHNVWIDTVTAYLYVEGFSSSDLAVHIFSLANPENPTYVNSFGPSSGIHDLYVINDTAYLAEGWNPNFSIWNLANKFSPQLLTRISVPTGGYVHNIWPTADGKYCMTTEETGFHATKIWDIQDFGNVQLLGEYLAPSNLAHNVQLLGNDRAYISHYESGVVVLDISDPNFPVERGRFDTYPADETPNFSGCWGVYQYAPSGKIYASNMDGILHILEEQAVVLDDTLLIETVQAVPGGDVRVDVHAVNNLPMRQFIIPFNWSGPFSMTLDSVSTVGLRTEYFEEQIFNGQNFANKRASFRLTSSYNGTSPDLDIGSGPILSLWFSVPFGVSGGPNPVILTPYNDKIPLFIYPCLTYEPISVDGAVAMSCCVGIAGNVDGDPLGTIDISDLTYFVDYLFAGGAAPPCMAEANIDGDISKSVDITDLTVLVDFLFGGGPFPAPCL